MHMLLIIAAFEMLIINTMGTRMETEYAPPYYLSFPPDSEKSYVYVIDALNVPLKKFTLCYRMRLQKPLNNASAHVLQAAVSYNTIGKDNVLLSAVSHKGRIEFFVNGDGKYTSDQMITYNDWHHLCSTWDSSTGTYAIYVGGREVKEVTDFKSGALLPPGGMFILGQEQDTLGGGFDSKQAFHGDLTDLQMWNVVLCKNKIIQLAHCEIDLEGNIISWKKMHMYLTDVEVVPSTYVCYNCQPLKK